MTVADEVLLITIFSIPKPFSGHIGIIQRNALSSWTRVSPEVEVILCGDEPGVAEAAREFGARHFPYIPRNDYGTPLLDGAFHAVLQEARNDLICYVNADIVLMDDLLTAGLRIPFERYLLIGQRWNVDLNHLWDFGDSLWQKRFKDLVAAYGTIQPPVGSDYFVFPRQTNFGVLPPFSVGREGWDNWFIYHARELGIPVIDVTKVVTAVHQNHDYLHVPDRMGPAYEGPESDANLQFLANTGSRRTQLDATHVLTPRFLWPTVAPKYIRRRVNLWRERRTLPHSQNHVQSGST
jgi:hypothetical protein